MSETATITLKTKLDEKGVENLQKKLRSYNLGEEFNYAVAVLKLLIANGETDTKSTVIKLVPKVQYITPFVSKELAEKYRDELYSLSKLVMFLPVNKDGRVDFEDFNIKDTTNDMLENSIDVKESFKYNQNIF